MHFQDGSITLTDKLVTAVGWALPEVVGCGPEFLTHISHGSAWSSSKHDSSDLRAKIPVYDSKAMNLLNYDSKHSVPRLPCSLAQNRMAFQIEGRE